LPADARSSQQPAKTRQKEGTPTWISQAFKHGVLFKIQTGKKRREAMGCQQRLLLNAKSLRHKQDPSHSFQTLFIPFPFGHPRQHASEQLSFFPFSFKKCFWFG